MRLFLLCVCLLYVYAGYAQTTRYVSATGNNANPGTATLPWQTIRYAVSQATSGDTISVVAGNYINTSTSDTTFWTNKLSTHLGGGVVINKNVIIKGAGADVTIFGKFPGTSANVGGQFFEVRNGGSLTLIGVTLQDGGYDSSGGIPTRGGAIMVAANSAATTVGTGNLKLIRCNLLRNTAKMAGAIAFVSSGTFTMEQCYLEANKQVGSAVNSGGAGLLISGGTTTINNCIFTEQNVVIAITTVGSVIHATNGILNLINNTFAKNTMNVSLTTTAMVRIVGTAQANKILNNLFYGNTTMDFWAENTTNYTVAAVVKGNVMAAQTNLLTPENNNVDAGNTAASEAIQAIEAKAVASITRVIYLANPGTAIIEKGAIDPQVPTVDIRGFGRNATAPSVGATEENSLSALSVKVDQLQNYLKTALVGTGIGQYPQSAVNELQAAVNTAQTWIKTHPNAIQDEIDQQLNLLASAEARFESQIIFNNDNVSVTIKPSEVLCTKDPLWFGGNSVYPNSFGGTWIPSEQRATYAFINSAYYTGSSGFRFPGGTLGNLYKWKNAIGPLGSRRANLNAHSEGQPLSNEFGPYEMGLLHDATHMKHVIMMVAIPHEKPTDAADWVEFMNSPVGANPNGNTDWAQVRANLGHPEPFGIKQWEIGNEVYGDWEITWFNYPSTGDEKRGGSTIQAGNAKLYVSGGYRYFTNQRAIRDTSWLPQHALVNGTPNQIFHVKFAPISLEDATKPFILTINGETWTLVDNFNASGPTDKHFRLETTAGAIIFGDGTKGMAPTGNHNILVSYNSGKQPGFVDYYAAMKAVDPTIEVISCFEKEAFYKEMADINSPFDGVSKHYYPGGTPEAGTEYAFELSNSVNMQTRVKEHTTHLAKYPNKSIEGKPIKQWYSEYAPGGTGIGTFGVMQAKYDWLINKYADSVGCMFVHSYNKPDNTYMVHPVSGRMRTRAHPNHIFNHLHGNKFVKSVYTGETYSFRSATIQNATVISSMSEDGRVLTCSISNLRKDYRLALNITIENYPFADKAVVGKRWKAVEAFDINTTRNTEGTYLGDPEFVTLGAVLKDTLLPYETRIYQWIAEDRTYLSDLTPTLIQGGEIKKDVGFSTQPIQVNYMKFTKSVSATSGTTIDYTVNKKYKFFMAEVGLDDNFTGGAATLEVYLDDVKTYTSPIIHSNSPNQKIMIDVKDATKVSFIIKTATGSNGNDYLTLGDARFVDLTGTVTGVEESWKAYVKVYPNPTKDKLLVTYPFADSGTLRILDLTGRTVYSQTFIRRDVFEIPMQSLTKGCYILSITGDKQTFASKIIKE